MAVFFEHMAEEEHLLPELRGAVGVEELVELGGRWGRGTGLGWGGVGKAGRWVGGCCATARAPPAPTARHLGVTRRRRRRTPPPSGRFKAVREGLLARAEQAHAAPLPA
jgi:hypothetical protein